MKDKMKAAVLTKPGCFEISLVEIPEIEFDDVLIKVDRCGICGTDLHIFNGTLCFGLITPYSWT